MSTNKKFMSRLHARGGFSIPPKTRWNGVNGASPKIFLSLGLWPIYVILFEKFYLSPSSIGGWAPQESAEKIGTHIAEVDRLVTKIIVTQIPLKRLIELADFQPQLLWTVIRTFPSSVAPWQSYSLGRGTFSERCSTSVMQKSFGAMHTNVHWQKESIESTSSSDTTLPLSHTPIQGYNQSLLKLKHWVLISEVHVYIFT